MFSRRAKLRILFALMVVAWLVVLVHAGLLAYKIYSMLTRS